MGDAFKRILETKEGRMALGCLSAGAICMFVCLGCFSAVDDAIEESAAYKRSPEGRAEAEKRRQAEAEEKQKFHDERMPWIIAQNFAEDHIRGDFDSKPENVQKTGENTYLVRGNCATPDGRVHRIVADVEYTGNDNWKCRELYIDAQRVR